MKPAALRESHVHLAMHGQALALLNLADCASRAQCLDLIRQEASRIRSAKGPHAWVLAKGARAESWTDSSNPGAWPSRHELDAAAGGMACVVMSFDHHAVVATTRAMLAAGITDATPDPEGGVIVRDTTGAPTGLLLESAAKRVWDASPAPTPSELRDFLRIGAAHLANLGFSHVDDLLSPPWMGPLLADLDAAGELPLHVRLYTPIDQFAAVADSRRAWETPRVRLAGGKLFADGTLNSATAWMLEPYAHPLPGMPTGKVIATPEQIRAALRLTCAHHLELAVHAIGDGAVRAVLDAREAVGRESTASPALRIEHCEIIDEADVPRFVALNVRASVQPCHLLYDIEVLQRQLPHRLHRVLPLRELLGSGLIPGDTLVFGSDVPIVAADPEHSIIAAVHRRRAPGAPGGPETSHPISPGQAITAAEAWKCFAAPA